MGYVMDSRSPMYTTPVLPRSRVYRAKPPSYVTDGAN